MDVCIHSFPYMQGIWNGKDKHTNRLTRTTTTSHMQHWLVSSGSYIIRVVSTSTASMLPTSRLVARSALRIFRDDSSLPFFSYAVLLYGLSLSLSTHSHYSLLAIKTWLLSVSVYSSPSFSFSLYFPRSLEITTHSEDFLSQSVNIYTYGHSEISMDGLCAPQWNHHHYFHNCQSMC